MQQRDRLFDHPAVNAQAGAVLDAFASKVWDDFAVVQQQPVWVGVIGPVGVQRQRPLARSAAPAADGAQSVDQGFELGDIVAVPAGQAGREGDAGAVDDQVVLRARSGTVDRARTGFGPPFMARM